MATLVLGAGTSHTPMLSSGVDGWSKIAQRDRTNPMLLDAEGRAWPYEELESRGSTAVLEQLSDDIFEEKYQRCQDGIEELGKRIQAANLDALIIVGDDQSEHLFSDNLPPILIYYGETIRNTHLTEEQANEFLPGYREARLRGYYEADGDRDYPVATELAQFVIGHLLDNSFDIAASDRLPRERAEGHAFQFVHRRVLRDAVPVIPVMLNAYHPPTQPRVGRCYEFGQALRRAVEAWPQEARVGIIGSGGLTHFVIDEEFDLAVLKAFEERDAEMLKSIPEGRLQGGTSEVKNWIAVAGACEHLTFDLIDYVPGYRSPAGTGTAMGFATWA